MIAPSPASPPPRKTAYDRLLELLAGIGGAILAVIALGIAADVLLRTAGFEPFAHTLALTEYGLLYATLLGAPWLLRTHGHVHVEIVVSSVPPAIRTIMIKAACFVGLVSCLIVAWWAADTAYVNFTRGAFDMRSFDMPRWLLFAPIAPSFLLMAYDFGRFLFGKASLHGDAASQSERA